MNTLRLFFLFHLSLFAAVLIGCGAQSGGDGRASSSDREGTAGPEVKPTTARVVCDGDGVRVLTPEVAARPDGVHLSIDNRLDGNAELSVSHLEGGMGWSVPSGESGRVANVPPGKVNIDCHGRSWGRDRLFGMKVGTLRVSAGDSGYKSTKLDCPREKSGRIEPYTKAETEEQKGDPVEIFRRSNSGSLREGDVVEAAGNTRSQGEKTVRVVRDGKVVATAHYLKFSAGWMEATEENCAGF